jgi:hypothetical protein
MEDILRAFLKQVKPAKFRVNHGLATRWGRDDDRFFRKHRRRAHRVRAAFPNEYPDDPPFDCVVIRQIQPGWRARVQFGVAECAPEMVETMTALIARGEREEAAAHLMFDMATTHRGRLITPAELTEMIANYEATPQHDGDANELN